MSSNESDENQPDNFVSHDSLKNYTVATGSLTLVINTSLYIYKSITDREMPNGLLISIALSLSILYILSFFKRKKGLAMSKYLWMTFLNSIMLFTSISGVNGMLDTARQEIDTKNPSPLHTFNGRGHLSIAEASIGKFFKHLILPTHGWFNAAEAEQNKTKGIVLATLSSIETTQNLTDSLIKQKARDIKTIDTLYKTIDTLRVHYIKILDLFQKAESDMRALQSLLKVRTILQEVIDEVTQTAPGIETDRRLSIQQQQEREQQRQVQQQQIQQLQERLQKLQKQRQQLKDRAF
jgi:hypothetical protein